MVGLNYDDDAWVIIGTGRYIVFMNDEFSQERITKSRYPLVSIKGCARLTCIIFLQFQ